MLKLELVLQVAGLSVAGALLAGLKDFSRATFLKVFKWAIFANLVTAAMIEFAFARDHTSGASLVIVTCMLAVFTLSVPTTIAFTVARYADDSVLATTRR